MVECGDALTPSLPPGHFFFLLFFPGHLVLSPPPPHTGPALISALNILEGFNLTTLVSREQALHWVAEARPTPLPCPGSWYTGRWVGVGGAAMRQD